MSKEEEKKEEKKEEKISNGLLADGCKAYGVAPEFVFSSRVDKQSNTVIIVTVGGSKVRFSPGMEIKPLDPIRITGVNPAAKKRKPITGGK